MRSEEERRRRKNEMKNANEIKRDFQKWQQPNWEGQITK